jgi:hypothetical protein
LQILVGVYSPATVPAKGFFCIGSGVEVLAHVIAVKSEGVELLIGVAASQVYRRVAVAFFNVW